MNEGIEFFNRHTGQREREQVMGEKALRWTYGTPWGRAALWTLLKRGLFSRLYGSWMDRPKSRESIAPFVQAYGIDMNDYALGVEDFASFNEFFYRTLRPGARPLAPCHGEAEGMATGGVESEVDGRVEGEVGRAIEDVAVFPADGRHMAFPNISKVERVFVKGQSFDLPALLGNATLAENYKEGTLIISRLCPTDYHRFHFPVSGIPGEARLIPGALVSVSPYALRRRLAWLWENKRVITELDSETWGRVLLIEVGATCVGSILQTYTPGKAVIRGEEKGYFAFGGSTVITLFEPGRIVLDEDLRECSARGEELYARMGSSMGSLVSV